MMQRNKIIHKLNCLKMRNIWKICDFFKKTGNFPLKTVFEIFDKKLFLYHCASLLAVFVQNLAGSRQYDREMIFGFFSSIAQMTRIVASASMVISGFFRSLKVIIILLNLKNEALRLRSFGVRIKSPVEIFESLTHFTPWKSLGFDNKTGNAFQCMTAIFLFT